MRAGSLVGLAALSALSALAARADAAPLLNDHVGGLAFAGPTETHVLAIWYNPAALTDPRLDDNKVVVYLGGNLLLRQAEVARFPIDPTTGQPTGGSADPKSALSAKQPDGFLGFYLRVSEKIVFGLASHTPYRDYGGTDGAGTLDPGDDGPLRYQRLHTWFYDFWVHPAVSISIGKNFSLGFGLPFSYTDLRELSFDRDGATDCPPPGSGGAATGACASVASGYERPENVQRIRLSGSNWNLAVQFGLLVRIREKFNLGLSFISPQFWFDRTDVRLDGDGERPNATLSRRGLPDAVGFARIRYRTPYIFQLGLRWLVTSKTEALLNVRASSFGVHDSLELRLASGSFRSADLPERIVRYRGLRWSARTDLRSNHRLTDAVRIGGGLGFELSPVPADAMSADTMDGDTVFANVRAEWHPTKGFFFSGGYELGFMLPRTLRTSIFDPRAGSVCAAAERALDDPACAATLEGRGVPGNAGEYSQLLHTVSLGAGFDWTW